MGKDLPAGNFRDKKIIMGRKSAKENLKQRFGDPMRVEVHYSRGDISPSEESYQNDQLSKAYVEVLRGVLGREPTQDEILGKKDISTKLRKKYK